MRKFIMISDAYEGGVILYYNDGLLACVDVRETNMDDRGRLWLFANIPVFETGLLEFSKRLKSSNIAEDTIEIDLDDFKREYPYARNSHLLPPIWKKMNKSEQVKAYLAAREYRRYCDREARWYKPKIAAAWLRAKEYMNDWRKM